MELKDIRIIIDLMKKNDLSLFELEKEGFKIKLKKGPDAPGGYAVSAIPAAAPAFQPVSAPPASAASLTASSLPETLAAAPAAKGREIVSPMVGTFYAAMSPDAPAYVKVGQTVTEDTVVCIIEAMKVMNEIKSEVSGTVTEVLGENGKPVQYGQALFRVA